MRSASLPDPRKGIAFKVAIEAERSRGAEAAVIRVQGRVAFFTARRTDTAIMVVRHRNTSGPDANRRADENSNLVWLSGLGFKLLYWNDFVWTHFGNLIILRWSEDHGVQRSAPDGARIPAEAVNPATSRMPRMRFPPQTPTVRRLWEGCRPFD